jgi:tRNA A37 threonylcarbamoyladenosine dehydratase
MQTETQNLNQSLRSESEMETYKLHRRFDRMGRLIGDSAMTRLFQSHVMIVGLGGVGSWSAESIVRSGVGKVTVIDFDEICVTNANRQLHALTGLVGQNKADVMAERLRKINPQAEIISVVKFYNERHCEEIFGTDPENYPDYVIDAIDNVTAKCHLLAFCKKNVIPVVTSTGSGGRMDPTRIRATDLADTTIDPLAKAVRRILRSEHGFPEQGPFGITAVFSEEPATMPKELKYDNGKGFQCVCPQGDNPYNTCDNKNLIMGNASFVTGAFGLACAARVVRDLTLQA